VTVRYRILGSLDVCGEDDVALRLGGRKQRSLLALLLLNRNTVVSTDRLLEEVWRDSAPQEAGRSLQVYVSQLRKLLGRSGILESRGGGYVLTVADEQLDAARFERLAGEGRRLLSTGDVEDAAERLQDALALWRGPVLADLAYEEFAQPAIVRLEELRLTALEARVEADLMLGRHAELVSELETLVKDEPLRERIRGQLMLALYRSGRQADALAAYQDARSTLLDELGLEPSPELRQLEAAILRQDPALDIEPAELRARRRLPSPATVLVGRRREVEEVVALLRGEARLVTLTGAGGTGKTRVALQAAHELADVFPHGVVFVGLAPLLEPELVPAQIGSALGAEGPLGEHLRERTTLLLLDNFEQVDEAAPGLAELLGAAPGLRLLVTSRRPLRLYGEHEFPVPPLLDDEAIELFVARARAVKHSFVPSPAVAELCAGLHRLPLAIELAAARVRELSLDDMLRMLSRRLELAAGGPRDAPARQQSLWATIDWSHGLLDEAERELFAQLAVFVGGWTLTAAQAVCAADAGTLASLVEKSLLLEPVQLDPEPRFGMLETIREYALERLDELGDAERIRRLHAVHFLELACAGEKVRRQPAEVEWFDRLEPERENLRAALEFLLQHDVEAAARLADGAYRFWYTRGLFEDGLRACERVLSRGAGLELRMRANLHVFGAAFAFGRRDLPRALALAEEALTLQRELGELDAIARALVLVGTVASEGEDHQRAVPALEEAVDVAREHGDSVVLNFAQAHLLLATLNAGLYERTIEVGAEVLTATRAAGDAESEATALGNLGIALVRTGDPAAAAEHFAGALSFAISRGDPLAIIAGIEQVAATAAELGEPRRAARLLAAAEALAHQRDLELETGNVRLREDTVARLAAVLNELELDEEREAGRLLTLEAAAAQAAEVAGRLRVSVGRPQDR
jgi:predicted ATPase/DNA-binding SARP family transcriptional activator